METSALRAMFEIDVPLALWRTLARHLPAHVVRGIEADLRANAGASASKGDRDRQQWIAEFADALVSVRPELFGH